MTSEPKASGTLDPKDPLYAPGIRRRKRVGQDARYWMPLPGDIKRGYPLKLLTFPPDLPEAEVAARCRMYQAELKLWRAGKEGPAKNSIAWLIDRYTSDEFSPFQKLRFKSQKNYGQDLRIIRKTIGRVMILPESSGNAIAGEDVWRWHKGWGAGAKTIVDGKEIVDPPRPSRARHVVTQFRILVKYAVSLRVPGAADLNVMLSAMEFPTTAARTVAPDLGQVLAFVAKALELGRVSIAATTLAQFELIERRISIIGSWEGSQWRPGWTWQGITPDWSISYQQRKRRVVDRQFDLKATPLLLDLLQRTPEDRRVGPVIICETTGQPWREKHYTDTWRKIARAAGIPDEVCSMDMRAGGATEADALGITDRHLKDAGGWVSDTFNRYRRDKARNAQNVVKLRQENRRSTSEAPETLNDVERIADKGKISQ